MPGGPATAPWITGLGFFGASARSIGALAAVLKSPARALPAGSRSDSAIGSWAVGSLPPIDLRGDLDDSMASEARARALRAGRRAPDAAKAALIAATEAWLMAGLPWNGEGRDRFAIVAAAQNCGTATIAAATDRLRAEGEAADPYLVPHGLDSFSLSLTSETLDLRGEGSVAGAAQASGHAALIQAARLLAVAEADVVLVLGVPQVLSAAEVAGYRTLGALAGERGCRPFDAATQGFVPVEMAAALVIERAETAVARAAVPLAHLAGGSMRMHASAQPAPDRHAEIAVMRQAVAQARLSPPDIGLVCAHATGTPLGDRTEAEAIAAVFGDRVLVNAPKGIVGHGLASAGIVETGICVLALRERIAHGNAGLERPLVPGLRYAGAEAEEMRIGAILNTGFGFGGFNAAVVITAPER